jgi:hypothetical protein
VKIKAAKSIVGNYLYIKAWGIGNEIKEGERGNNGQNLGE